MTSPRSTDPPWTPDDDRKLLKMNRAGMDKLTVARKLGRTVVAIVRRYGRLRRPRRPAT
jgi:hypothetical protein